ncbi:DUF211 domain-containing protein [Aliiglaciecola sp. LCG003]|uniref:DUF211 domain-containing protein n=1 Tax=Aliiglaciecola sp. LCG003 TaxID=3053655 RepID=UPI00257428EE|nr:DUF211 domain-containing protein [Aliiglaciecola sp. LCG003]WJG07682.1 DUF211 domain-containing protein [Aliiglaciecola sp. LCG003]
MSVIQKIVLDILKPHQPNAADFALAIVEAGIDYKVYLSVIEVDESTESLRVEIQADDINFEQVQTIIKGLGASIHSVDEVHACNLKVNSALGN